MIQDWHLPPFAGDQCDVDHFFDTETVGCYKKNE